MKTVFATLFILCVQQAVAQDKVDELMYQTYIGGKDSKTVKEQFQKAVDDRQVEFNKLKNDKMALYNLAVAQFALLSSTMREQDEDLFDQFYSITVKNFEKLISLDKNWAEPHALLSATYGLKMGYSPWQGMFLGPKSSSEISKAKKANVNSPIVWKVIANSKYFTPEMWGGDLRESIEAYEKCISLYESAPSSLKFNWMYLDAMAFLGQAYKKNGQLGKAISIFERSLQVEPEFGWVKHVLLPAANQAALNK